MRIIDKTPWQDAQGNIGLTARLQGTLKYGLNWYGELEAQKAVIAQLDRMLEKGFVLIRNFTLPNSEIILPIILIGAGGIWIIQTTNVKGYFEARGDQWNTISNGNSQPARVNLLKRVLQLSRAFQKYLELQKFNLSLPVEPVLIASDPGAQIESLRPAVRVVRSDAIKQFGSSLLQVRPILSAGAIYDLADQIIDPSLRKEEQKPVSRAQAIFQASETPQEFNPSELGFAFEEEGSSDAKTIPPETIQPGPANPPIPAAKRGILGMSTAQSAVLAVMLIVECCVLIGFAFILYQFQ